MYVLVANGWNMNLVLKETEDDFVYNNLAWLFYKVLN